MGRFLY